MKANWNKFETRRHFPKSEGRYLVTRQFSDGSKEVVTAKLVKYKNRWYWCADRYVDNPVDNYPYDNIIAWMEIPEPFEE